MYKYSFEPKKRIAHCWECKVEKYQDRLDCKYSCSINLNVECSDITRPDDCPLEEERVEKLNL